MSLLKIWYITSHEVDDTWAEHETWKYCEKTSNTCNKKISILVTFQRINQFVFSLFKVNFTSNIYQWYAIKNVI